MIKIIQANQRHKAHHGWLTTYYLFSFARYFDPENLNFGVLRVFNDDIIMGQSGFGEHNHDNMEIVTLVLEGELTHKDSMGNTGVIKAGEVQHMSAGTGIEHAELNAGIKPVHLYQIWLIPKAQNLKPTYHQKNFTQAINTNKLTALASGQNKPDALPLFADATIYAGNLLEGQNLTYSLPNDRGAFFYLTNGELLINGIEAKPQDQARITLEQNLDIKAITPSQFIMIDTSLNI